MVTSCIAYGCTNRHVKGSVVTFSRVPKNEPHRSKWINALKRVNYKPNPKSQLYVCSDHFEVSDYEEDPKRKIKILKEGVVPHVFKNFPSYLKPKTPKQRRTIIKHELPRKIKSKEDITPRDFDVSANDLMPMVYIHCHGRGIVGVTWV